MFRRALVIGNSKYKHKGYELDNPRNDATAMADLLAKLGFAVDARYDLETAELLEALTDFEEKTNGAEDACLFYAGHSFQLQLNGVENYLIPVDTNFDRPST